MGGGKWIMMNKYLQVCKRTGDFAGQDLPGDVWAGGRVWAIGDCNYGCIMKPGIDPKNVPKGESPFIMPPIPKISYPGEEQALHAVKNLEKFDKRGASAKM